MESEQFSGGGKISYTRDIESSGHNDFSPCLGKYVKLVLALCLFCYIMIIKYNFK